MGHPWATFGHSLRAAVLGDPPSSLKHSRYLSGTVNRLMSISMHDKALPVSKGNLKSKQQSQTADDNGNLLNKSRALKIRWPRTVVLN